MKLYKIVCVAWTVVCIFMFILGVIVKAMS